MNTDYVDKFENYDRKLIKLNSDTAILLHIFKKALRNKRTPLQKFNT